MDMLEYNMWMRKHEREEREDYERRMISKRRWKLLEEQFIIEGKKIDAMKKVD